MTILAAVLIWGASFGLAFPVAQVLLHRQGIIFKAYFGYMNWGLLGLLGLGLGLTGGYLISIPVLIDAALWLGVGLQSSYYRAKLGRQIHG